MFYTSFSSYSTDSDGNQNNQGYSMSQQQYGEPDIFEYDINNNNGKGSIIVKRGNDVLLDDTFQTQAELEDKLDYINEINMALEDNIDDALNTRADIIEENEDLEKILELNDLNDEDADGLLARIGDNEGIIQNIDYMVDDNMNEILLNEEDAETAMGISRENPDGISEASTEINSPLSY